MYSLVKVKVKKKIGTGSFLRVKWLGHGANHPPPSIPKVKERVELYFYSPSGPAWLVPG
jgi:hypothetical protein